MEHARKSEVDCLQDRRLSRIVVADQDVHPAIQFQYEIASETLEVTDQDFRDVHVSD
nr:hypothetical protein [Paraburkholderia kururiensis]